MTIIFYLVANVSAASRKTGEAELLKQCSQENLVACERLGTYYLASSAWEKGLIVGDALCRKDIPMGCTIAGTALMSLDKVPQGIVLLNQSCDGFEPYACRSLARFKKIQKAQDLSDMYHRRACFYGLKESCPLASEKKTPLSPAAMKLIQGLKEDCSDEASALCKDFIKMVDRCEHPLTKDDCLLLPGELSIQFRAKLLQAEAKLSLLALHRKQKELKTDPKVGSHTYDLKRLLRETEPLKRYQYVFGFMGACGRKFHRRRTLTNSQEVFPKAYDHLPVRTLANNLNYLKKWKAQDCYDPKAGYEAFAVGNLDPLDPTRLDVWKIDQDMRLQHVLDGSPLP